VVEQTGFPAYFGVFFRDPEIHFCIDPETPLKPKLIQKSIFALILGPISGKSHGNKMKIVK
jgi:hypothetical protein